MPAFDGNRYRKDVLKPLLDGGRSAVQGQGQAGHDFLGGVGHGGKRVRTEHGQPDGVAQLGVMGLIAGQAASQDEAAKIWHGYP